MAKIIDPLQALQEDRRASGEPSARDVAKLGRKRPQGAPAGDMRALLESDFRQFLILLWQHLLGVDPTPAMLDMAWYLQHGPNRSIIMAFRGFSKSWITGAYALWRLYCDPQEKVLVVSGSLPKATANTNWCLMLIHTWPLLAHLKPKANQRQSSRAFDVGPATPEQSPSFHALGIGGQAAGWRATVIIPDDVETAQNSITPDMRHKNAEAVKEFDSILKPGPASVIKYLGTPHDEDSLYNVMSKRGYAVRIWPAMFPTEDQIKKYGDKLAPWITSQIKKLGPTCVGHSIMPTRFPDDDLATRRASLGQSEFALQFMLDTTLSDANRYPLKLRDLMVMGLDPRKGPDSVTWTTDAACRVRDIPCLGHDGDGYFHPVLPPGAGYVPYNRIIGAVDNSGRGDDETALVIIAELAGTLYLLHLWASKAGFDVPTLKHISQMCVRFRVQKLKIEANFGDGMFATLLRPVLTKEWELANKAAKRLGKPLAEQDGGTSIEEIRVSNLMAKERRILSILEPVTQQHRLVMAEEVVRWDYDSLEKIEGEDTRHRYALMYQYAHLTRERDSLAHEDRLDALALGVSDFADILGVDPAAMAKVIREDAADEEFEKFFEVPGEEGRNTWESDRPVALRPQPR